jgi:hypothetical protein
VEQDKLQLKLINQYIKSSFHITQTSQQNSSKDKAIGKKLQPVARLA